MQTNIFHKAKEIIKKLFHHKKKVTQPKHYTEIDLENIATGYTIAPDMYKSFLKGNKKGQSN